MPRLWKHEKAIRRTEALIEQSDKRCDCACCTEWHTVARRICASARLLKSGMTPMVLHCIDVGGSELCELRHDNARLFLLTAQAMLEDKLMVHMMNFLFPNVFPHRPVPGTEQPQQPPQAMPFHAMLMSALQQITNLPEGASMINIGGVPAQVIKFPDQKGTTGQPKKGKSKPTLPQDGNNSLN